MNSRSCPFTSLAVALLLRHPGIAQAQGTAVLEINLGTQYAGFSCVVKDPSMTGWVRFGYLDALGHSVFRLLPAGEVTIELHRYRQDGVQSNSAQIHLEPGETKILDRIPPTPLAPFPPLPPPPKATTQTHQALRPQNPALKVIPDISRLPAYELPDSLTFAKGKVSFRVFPDRAFSDPAQPELLAGIFNDTDQDANIPTYDPLGTIRFEARNAWGRWKPIEFSPLEGRGIGICGTGLSDGTILPAHSCVLFPVRRYQGFYPTKLRVRCGDLVSEPFEGSIERDQFKKPKPSTGH